jgi:hypothetical protein
MLRTKIVEVIKIHILSSIWGFPDNRAVFEIVWKKHKLHGYISTATVVTRTRHSVMLCIHCPSFLFYHVISISQCIASVVE